MEAFSQASAAGNYLVEIAPLTRSIETILELAEDAWAISFANGTAALAEWADRPSRLVLTADLGQPSQDRAAQVLSTALSFNALWREHGSLRLAQAGEQGDLMLIANLPADSGLAESFTSLVDWFSDVAEKWAAFMEGSSTQSNSFLLPLAMRA